MQGVVIIPARYASSRFEGKPLAPIAGTPMITHVIRRCMNISGIDRIIVATDDSRIATVARESGAEAVMTSPDCPSGTDRVAEVASELTSAHIINVQGDEPLLPPGHISMILTALQDGHDMATLDFPLDPSSAADPSIVKVVKDCRSNAIYFSRSLIPFPRVKGQYYKHIGVYGYQRKVLMELVNLPQPPEEVMEGLEQLRALHHGYTIHVCRASEDTVAVDEPCHIKQVERILAENE